MNKYTDMQKKHYEAEAKDWSVTNRNPVVGMFDSHNSWPGYENLFKNITNTSDKIALDFGCGPGRNIVKYNSKFKRIDGVDIAENNIIKAKEWISYNEIPMPNLFVCNGEDISEIKSDSYDVVFSTICFQHICVYSIRFRYLQEFFRVLKSGGILSFQMGYGKVVFPGKVVSNYYDNNYEALATNGRYDCIVESADQLKKDLDQIGFISFDHTVTEVGPGDGFSNWIFFRVTKP